MESLTINVKGDTERLMGMLLMDIGRYKSQRIEDGILINFDKEDESYLASFGVRFSAWLTNEVFTVCGNEYFKSSRFEEKWKMWRNDFRFRKTYCDEFYKEFVERSFIGMLYEVNEYDSIRFHMKDIILCYKEAANLRFKLIEEHFKDEIHEDYILLKLKQES